MSLKLSQSFAFFRSLGLFDDKKETSGAKQEASPTLKVQTDKEIYRPGDSVTATIEICSPRSSKEDTEKEDFSSLLIDNVSFEVKGERLFLDCTAPSIVSKVIVTPGHTKTYIVRVELPNILPPSYRGISIRYIYYVRSTLYARWLVLDNPNHDRGSTNNLIQLEARAPLQIWVSQKSSNLLNEEGKLLISDDQLNIFWKEKDDDSEWARANENVDGFEEGYDSSRDEVSSVSSYNPAKANVDFVHRNSLSMQSMSTRLSTSELYNSHGEHSGFPSYAALPRLSISEVIDDPGGAIHSPQMKLNHSSSTVSPVERNSTNSYFLKDEVGSPFTPKHVEPTASEGFIRGRSYNIRIGDQIGGTLTFFHGEGVRRCLEVSVTLETSETINQRVIHPSRKGSPTITKVHSEHHEVVADLLQTSFLFSIPIDGPTTFSTSKISVQWYLRFEFFTTPEDLDLRRYEHPLLIEQREKGDWVLPISVYAPPLRRQAAETRNERSLSLGNLLPP
ncbi:RAB6A-GEF complex partner protein 2 [Ananas comosus]|uniref:RAB6A-GEF complex partner protein 2 n=1 Tax=Ananas comosus TaxID=4615 RepID=A0A199UND4_ANACO|nr:RAB6A-GEF complex partner protein 2 [Ananas comosus]